MQAKYLSALFIVCLIIIFSQHSIISASSDTMLNEFKFFNIGAEDTKNTAEKKLDAKGFQCLQGKATYFHIRDIQKQSISRKTTEKIEEIMAMDEDFKNYGEDLSIKDMPVNIVGCTPQKNSPFGFSTFYFSKFDQKILAIGIEVNQFNLLKDKLTSKFGSCISEGYCEIGDSILILAEISGLHLKVYYYENLKSYHERIKKIKVKKDKKNGEKIDEAFE